MRFSFFCVLFFLLKLTVHAQSESAADRKISFSVSNQPVTVILKKIESLSGCRFTYASGLIPAGRRTTLSVNNKSVRQLLPVLLGSTIQYRVRGNYIILTENKNQQSKSGNVIIRGVINDAVSNVS